MKPVCKVMLLCKSVWLVESVCLILLISEHNLTYIFISGSVGGFLVGHFEFMEQVMKVYIYIHFVLYKNSMQSSWVVLIDPLRGNNCVK